jgi:hypothetical protein
MFAMDNFRIGKSDEFSFEARLPLNHVPRRTPSSLEYLPRRRSVFKRYLKPSLLFLIVGGPAIAIAEFAAQYISFGEPRQDWPLPCSEPELFEVWARHSPAVDRLLTLEVSGHFPGTLRGPSNLLTTWWILGTLSINCCLTVTFHP